MVCTLIFYMCNAKKISKNNCNRRKRREESMMKKNIITSLALAALFAVFGVEQANARWFTDKRIEGGARRLGISKIEFLKKRQAEMTERMASLKKRLEEVAAEIKEETEKEKVRINKKATALGITKEKVIEQEAVAKKTQKTAGAGAQPHRRGRWKGKGGRGGGKGGHGRGRRRRH